MKQKTLLSLALILMAVQGAMAQADKKPVYVSLEEMPDGGYFLPAPPDTASMDYVDDLLQWQWGKSVRNTPRGQKSSDESPWEPYIMQRVMAQALGLDTICEENTPALNRFLVRAYYTGNTSTVNPKKKYMRIRPFMQMGEDTWAQYDTDFLRTNGSYPSGHTSLGWGTALAIAEMWPELQDTILRRGFEFGENRVITGAHYQSDVNAGYMCAAAALARAHNNPQYEEDIRAARAEYMKLKGLPAQYDYTAKAGLPCGAKILNAPVDTASYRFLGELSRYWKAKSLRSTERGRQAVEDARCTKEDFCQMFGSVMGIAISKKQTPALYELIDTVRKASLKAAHALNKTAFRKRPYVQLREATSIPDEEARRLHSSSFASAHANMGWSLALVMAEVAPACQDELLRRGFDYGYSRLITGYHWATDIEAGRLLACAVVTRLHADLAFRKLVEKARKEYKKLK